MPTIVEENGYRIQINTRDHPPPDVHVHKAGCEARFTLQRSTVTLMTNAGMKLPELIEAQKTRWKALQEVIRRTRKDAMGEVKLTPITEEALQKANKKATQIATAPSAVIDAKIEDTAHGTALRLLFRNGEAVVIPTRLISELEAATDAQIRRFEISPLRDSIGFPDLDVHIYIPGLLVDLLSPLIRAEVARQAGRKSTAKKAAAVRENGKKGGRRKKQALAVA